MVNNASAAIKRYISVDYKIIYIGRRGAPQHQVVEIFIITRIVRFNIEHIITADLLREFQPGLRCLPARARVVLNADSPLRTGHVNSGTYDSGMGTVARDRTLYYESLGKPRVLNCYGNCPVSLHGDDH